MSNHLQKGAFAVLFSSASVLGLATDASAADNVREQQVINFTNSQVTDPRRGDPYEDNKFYLMNGHEYVSYDTACGPRGVVVVEGMLAGEFTAIMSGAPLPGRIDEDDNHMLHDVDGIHRSVAEVENKVYVPSNIPVNPAYFNNRVLSSIVENIIIHLPEDRDSCRRDGESSDPGNPNTPGNPPPPPPPPPTGGCDSGCADAGRILRQNEAYRLSVNSLQIA